MPPRPHAHSSVVVTMDTLEGLYAVCAYMAGLGFANLCDYHGSRWVFERIDGCRTRGGLLPNRAGKEIEG